MSCKLVAHCRLWTDVMSCNLRDMTWHGTTRHVWPDMSCSVMPNHSTKEGVCFFGKVFPEEGCVLILVWYRILIGNLVSNLGNFQIYFARWRIGTLCCVQELTDGNHGCHQIWTFGYVILYLRNLLSSFLVQTKWTWTYHACKHKIVFSVVKPFPPTQHEQTKLRQNHFDFG